jgi:hypothetical protein
LCESSLIAVEVFEEVFDILVDDQPWLDTLLFGKVLQRFQGALYGLGEVKEAVVQLKLHLLELRQIKEVIYQIEKHGGAKLTVFKITCNLLQLLVGPEHVI